ncbi:hypothetical protein V1477_020512, partial [Vespula maculifrons]
MTNTWVLTTSIMSIKQLNSRIRGRNGGQFKRPCYENTYKQRRTFSSIVLVQDVLTMRLWICLLISMPMNLTQH